ncbi:MAG TPA: wax ester/triacylglycerol synthase family O-acyltransferase [Candidatus Udaeobacter sp.]|nr:wax ester/triacylglycerol synthase family O-acyltransferase [Candidatus Udaeobacter sp.]
MAGTRRLNALEASFLGMEQPGIPMHVGGVSIFEGRPAVTMGDLHRLVQTRLRRLLKFRQRVVADPLGLMRGQWTRAQVDLDAHLFHHRLRAPGRKRDLFALCARIQEAPLSRERPLWEMHLIDGLEGGEQALLIKTHHSITDGLAGIEIAEVLFDPADGAPRPHLPEMRFATAKAPSAFGALQSLLGLGAFVAGGPLSFPGPFNGPVGPHRVFGATQLPMDAVQHAKKRLGGTIDDVIVATVAAGLYRYLQDVGYPDMPRALRAMLPVSTRRPGRDASLGNHVSSIFVDLPMYTDDVAELLPAIVHSKATLRSAHAAAGGSLMVEAAGLLPEPMHRQLLRVVSALPFASLVLSDVPGPDLNLELLGHRVSVCYPLMPLTSNIGLSIAAISLGGKAGIGITADPGLVPNPQRVADSIGRVFAALEPRRAVRTSAPQRVTRRAA